jgi:hypothetical protein
MISAVLLLAGCQAQSLTISSNNRPSDPPAAPPTTKTNTWIPVSYTGFAECTGEDILVSGAIHVRSNVWSSSSRLRIQSHINENLAAQGLSSGIQYRVVQTKNQMFETDVTAGSSVADDVFHFNVISATGAANFNAVMNGTWHWDPNGNVTLEPQRWELVCRG